MRQYVWASAEGPRALFDRARVHMLKERILLPAMTVLVRLVGEVRRAENERLHALLSGRLSAEMRAALVGLLAVPEGWLPIRRRRSSWGRWPDTGWRPRRPRCGIWQPIGRARRCWPRCGTWRPPRSMTLWTCWIC
ncbi:hypothetical protein [Nonomuraea sp. NPDC005692]|uniref:hypothetical protein n=1 Tax=Nonomuraea sp. NPDC005692 TaxID=3157168 RepID=UPI0033C59007